MANVLCISHEWNLGFEELRTLADSGFRVIPAPNGYDAIKQFAGREIDAIVLNRRLPDIDVADLVSYFRRHDARVPIVMVSTVMPLPAFPAEVDTVLNKHSCAELLAPTLELLLSGRDKLVADRDDSLAQAA